MREFKNKLELVAFVKHLLNITLENEEGLLNRHRNVLYTKITDRRILSLLCEYGIFHEKHMHDYYWIHLKNKKNKPIIAY